MSSKKTSQKNPSLKEIKKFNDFLNEKTGITIGRLIDLYINGDLDSLKKALSVVATMEKTRNDEQTD